jgi:Mrp family chromosome partitioning ATPase/capsular polysaccharide biosynthesis protein
LSKSAATNSDVHVLEQLLAVVRRRWKTLALFIVIGLVLGLLYAESQPPQYASSATVIVRSGFAADPLRQGVETTTPEEEGQFLSQLELIKSSSIANVVASKLVLEEDAAFAKPELAGWRRIVARTEALVGRKTGLGASAKPATLTREQVVSRLQANVKALRAGRTYVAAISYTHSDPATAQKVAQAFAEAFRQKLAEVSDLATSRVRAALQAELDRATPEQKPALQQKYTDLVVNRALPGMDAAIISDAKLPGAPIAPRKGFLVVVGAILGAAIGALLAGYREMSDRGIRDGDELARALRSRFAGYVESLKLSSRGKINTPVDGKFTLPSDARLSVTEPYGRLGEAVRNAAVSALAGQKDGQARTIGVISTLPGEGKTLVAANLAAHLGNQGRRVLLLDANIRKPDLSDWLAGNAEHGIVDVLLQSRPVGEAALYDGKANISFLPAALNQRAVDPAGLMMGPQIRRFIEGQRTEQDAIILDLPSLTSASDARAIEPLVDAFILVVEWAGPTEALIGDVLAGDSEIARKIAAVIMTRTDIAKLPLYVTAGSRGSFQKRIG